ncbi:MAG: LysR family transcriptional regulator [Oscillospiraceae bacterium]|nr:LysR family transcriptional regulator [Oscillospiraceae bacterium]
MRIENLQYLLEVAKTGSISAAAKNLWMGQTSLSSAIQTTENELGIKIFMRTSKGVKLTPKGEEAIAMAEKVLDDYQRLTEAAVNSRTQYSSCNIGCYPAFCTYLGSFITQKKATRFSDVSLNIIPILTRKLVTSITDGRCELGIGTIAAPELENIKYSAERQGLKFSILAHDYFCVIVNRHSPYWGRQRINIQEIRDDNFVSMSYSPQFTGSFPVTDWKSFQTQSVLGDLESVKQAVSIGNYIAITPHFSVIDDIYTRQGLIWPIRLTGFDSGLLIFEAHTPEMEKFAFENALLKKIKELHITLEEREEARVKNLKEKKEE